MKFASCKLRENAEVCCDTRVSHPSPKKEKNNFKTNLDATAHNPPLPWRAGSTEFRLKVDCEPKGHKGALFLAFLSLVVMHAKLKFGCMAEIEINR